MKRTDDIPFEEGDSYSGRHNVRFVKHNELQIVPVFLDIFEIKQWLNMSGLKLRPSTV